MCHVRRKSNVQFEHLVRGTLKNFPPAAVPPVVATAAASSDGFQRRIIRSDMPHIALQKLAKARKSSALRCTENNGSESYMRDVIASLQHVGRDESPHVDALCAVNPYFWAREWLNGLQCDRILVAEPLPKAELSDDVHGATDVLHRQAVSVISSILSCR